MEVSNTKKGEPIDHFEKFKEISVWVPIGCSVDLELETFKGWIDELPARQEPFLKFALFFHKELPQKRAKVFFNTLRDRFAENEVEVFWDVTDDEMTSIIAFCKDFNGEDEPDDE